jgi:DNA-directed RNA polymerase subunit L
MNAKVDNLKEDNGLMSFTLYNVDVSYANAVRRTILSDIPIIVFKTSPYELNKCTIQSNTSRLHNEIVKQRLSCVPICIKDIDFPIKNYVLEIDVENNTDTMLSVTTKDFKFRDLRTNKLVEEAKMREIFPPYIPPDGNGEYFIEFLHLRPRLSDEIPGERIKLSCELSVSNARDDASFNVVGTCSYGFTPDQDKMNEQLEIRKQKWKDEGKKEDEIKFEAANWKLLEGLRYVKKNSFDFVISSVGIYENEQIIIKACNIVVDKFKKLMDAIQKDELQVKPSDNTMQNCYDVVLENEDYTIGNILNYELYRTFYLDMEQLSYVGFKKMHPHDDDSLLRLALTDSTKGKEEVKLMIAGAAKDAVHTLLSIKGRFDGSRPENESSQEKRESW